jgi:hypothetical protein
MLSKKIRAFKKMNPDSKSVDIAKAFNTSPSYVYQVLSYKSAKEKKMANKPVAPTAGQDVLRKEIKHLNEANDKWQHLSSFQEGRIDVLTKQVRDLKAHHTGLEYVISYLESRLGIESKPNGSTV